MFSICVLLYGDHPDLARRCLSSIASRFAGGLVADVRVGTNAVSARTVEVVKLFAQSVPVPVHVYGEVGNRNVMKYPLMRRMIYDPERPMRGVDAVMWFDDDSYVKDGADRWLHDLRCTWLAETPAVMGSARYVPGYNWTLAELACFKTQPWYAGVPATTKPTFATGGWWVADLEFISRWDYPIRPLQHNGGDVLLGEICRQQGAKLLHNNEFVHINADATGRESAAKRRGVTTQRPFTRDDPFDDSHHDFDVKVTTHDARGRQGAA